MVRVVEHERAEWAGLILSPLWAERMSKIT